jgi:cobalt-zinc-cadmium efflux system protein
MSGRLLAMAHDHAHEHGARADAEVRPLAIALALIVGFMVVEVVVGILADSLALLSDAAHMLIDAAALALSVWAARLARRPARGGMTFGFRRAEILSAQANAITLLVLGVLIVVEAAQRLVSPPSVEAPPVVFTALAGAAVNVVAIWQVARANRENLNVEGSFQHLLTDFFAFAATVVAGAVIWATGFDRADAIASLGVAASMLYAALPLLRRTGRVLLEAAPEGVRPDDVALRHAMAATLLGTGDVDKARALLEGVVKEAPSFVDGHVLLATTYYRLKRKEDGDRERELVAKLTAENQARQPGAKKAQEVDDATPPTASPVPSPPSPQDQN